MSLSDRLNRAPRKAFTCRAAEIMAAVTGDDLDALKRVMADDAVSTAWLAQTLAEEGFPIGESTLRRHRTGRCTCGAL